MIISPAATPPELPWRLILLGGLVMAISIGLRAGLGVVVQPYALFQGWPLATVALAMALHNLLWGLVQPLVGGLADRHGARGVVAGGALAFAAGLAATAGATSPATALAGAGGAVGLGLAAASFPVVLALVGRASPPRLQAQAMGLAIALGSCGQVAVPPLVGWLVERDGVVAALATMAALALLMAPLAFGLGAGRAGGGPTVPPPSPGALAAAWASPSYRRLVVGFFACGFQLAFISLHLPGHLVLCGQPAAAGGWALAAMGLFNVAGCWLFGRWGGRGSPARLLVLLYLLRALAVAVLLLVPLTPASLALFSIITGLTWLATVPLTSAVIARLFGTGALGLLFGVAFLSHQLGSFAGALAGGWAFDATGSYRAVWAVAGGLGLLAALLHWPIVDTPPAAAPAPA